MKMIIGLSLLILGGIAIIVANFQYMLAEVDLLEKRPELTSVVYRKWFGVTVRWSIDGFYKSEFPNGRRIRNSWQWAIVGFLGLFSGFFVLAAR